ncbi:hypothetical protein DESPIG_01162 [Desulfovibrio piger ATCC 29098]|uniref:Uncharacterized protein n=1 Tax=Desulfovibrio piger ATCC 29098 TaxID=411464 RepID=B6WSW1_9BACT|nr:hypothetical protein DESPIG_01162 [Desulfovibrio piger ATCC 29098]
MSEENNVGKFGIVNSLVLSWLFLAFNLLHIKYHKNSKYSRLYKKVNPTKELP